MWDIRAGNGCARPKNFERPDLVAVVFGYLGSELLLDQALPE
jgi:hypothetical protein